MKALTATQVDSAIKRFGYYRTRRTQQVAAMGPPDGISGALLLALGLRETLLQNINGGARFDPELQKWVATTEDHGVFQISTRHHQRVLAMMPAVEVDTWGPVVPGFSAYDEGYCPRFEDSLQFTLRYMHDAQEQGSDAGIDPDDLGRFAVVAHNAGVSGALRGFREGNPDKYTAGGDYSTWIMAHRTKVNTWLRGHPKWKV